MGRPVIDLTGQTFGNQVVIAIAPNLWTNTAAEWIVRCGCGDVRVAQSTKLRNLGVSSCHSCSVKGARNGHWKHDGNVTYSAAHYRIRTAKGSARDHTCVDCHEEAAEWSFVGRVGYSTDLEDYIPRCRKCHRAYDRN